MFHMFLKTDSDECPNGLFSFIWRLLPSLTKKQYTLLRILRHRLTAIREQVAEMPPRSRGWHRNPKQPQTDG